MCAYLVEFLGSITAVVAKWVVKQEHQGFQPILHNMHKPHCTHKHGWREKFLQSSSSSKNTIAAVGPCDTSDYWAKLSPPLSPTVCPLTNPRIEPIIAEDTTQKRCDLLWTTKSSHSKTVRKQCLLIRYSVIPKKCLCIGRKAQASVLKTQFHILSNVWMNRVGLTHSSEPEQSCLLRYF